MKITFLADLCKKKAPSSKKKKKPERNKREAWLKR
jgi:hypothetical protein